MKRDILERPFPEALIRTRKGPFGQTFSYVEGAEYIRRLNEAFEGEWSFSVEEHIIRDNEVVVIGKLTVGAVTKMAFGGSSITVSREGEIISVADDLKAAATDALKKASSLFGIGLHLYSENHVAEPISPSRNDRERASKPTPVSKGNGGNGHSTEEKRGGNGVSKDRLTQKQLSCIWSLSRSLGLPSEAVRQRAVRIFGVNPEFLTKTDASSFITELGEAMGGNGATAS